MSERPAGPTAPSIDTQLQRVLQLAGAGRQPEAIAALQAALAVQPSHVAARCLLGAMLHDSGDSGAALQVLDGADPAVQELRASILSALGRAAEAELAARRALAAEPERPRALLSLALALDAQRRSAEAIDAARRLLALQPNQWIAHRLLARALLQSGRTDEALDAALQAALAADDATADAIADEFIAAAPPAAQVLLESLSQRHPRSY